MKRTPVSRLKIQLRPSRRLAGALVVAHLLTAAGVIACADGTLLSAALLAALAASLVFHLRRHAWLADARSVVVVELTDTLDCELEERSGRRISGIVLGATFVAPWLVVINVKVEESRNVRAIVVLPDATDRESFRALRVWLRWRKPEPTASRV
ncbi:MAG: protein YgfX [Burkholderiales bacterium]